MTAVNSVYSVFDVPQKATLETRTGTCTLGCSVTAVIRWLISWTNSMAIWFHALAVSIATEKKIQVFSSSPYFAILLAVVTVWWLALLQ